jgi:hypothetical protein
MLPRGRFTEFRRRRAIRANLTVSDGVLLTSIVRKLFDNGLSYAEYQPHFSGSSVRMFRIGAALPYTGGMLSSLEDLEIRILNTTSARQIEVSAGISDTLVSCLIIVNIFVLLVKYINIFHFILLSFVSVFPVAFAWYQIEVVMRFVGNVVD